AMMLFGAGFAFASGNLWALLTTGLAGLVLHFFVILPEERYLSAKFGIEYTDYTRRTRRWI
ncbi:MAG: isoprenylcysteine carboxylmethyltransferase family protein, partial [Pseudomonadota bacterium]